MTECEGTLLSNAGVNVCGYRGHIYILILVQIRVRSSCQPLHIQHIFVTSIQRNLDLGSTYLILQISPEQNPKLEPGPNSNTRKPTFCRRVDRGASPLGGHLRRPGHCGVC